MFKRKNFPVEVEDHNDLKIFGNIRRLGFHRVVSHAIIFPYAYPISWILKHIEIDKQYILNSKWQPITSFKETDLSKYYYLENRTWSSDDELLKKFTQKENYLFKIRYNIDKAFKLGPSS